jgi:gamma-glutamylcyclotransferase (GGCT)/AIG2-like uncharacterized protein YtfP
MKSEAHTELPLFVYGSLIDPEHRVEIIGRAIQGAPATLHGFERGRSLHWFIRRCDGAHTDGLLLADLDSGDYAVLDLYEEVPSLYTREQVEVMGQGGARIRCWVYRPTDWANLDSK